MRNRTLGTGGPTVSALGLGCMGMSARYGEAGETESAATIHAALDAGLSLLDIGDFYVMGGNELLVRDALRARPGSRDQAVISVKFGALRDAAGAWHGYDDRPAAVRTFLAHCLDRLGTDHIDIYRIARVDEIVPIEDTVGAIAEEMRAGRVRHIGLSQVDADTLRRAASVTTICDVQLEYSPFARGIEDDVLPTARELGISVTAYGVLPRHPLSKPDGHRTKGLGEAAADRGGLPGGDLTEVLWEIARSRGVTVAQTAIAWVLSRGEDIVPLIGARRRGRLAESLGALEVTLDEAELSALEQAVPA
jgi:aryl-alcohol dehydrogenase-like predicted oxidoreductase